MTTILQERGTWVMTRTAAGTRPAIIGTSVDHTAPMQQRTDDAFYCKRAATEPPSLTGNPKSPGRLF